MPGQFIKVEPGGAYVVSNSNGEFSFVAEEGENKITWIVKSYWQSNTASHSFTFPITEPIDLNFPLTWKTVNDVSVAISATAVRPGFNSISYINFINKGSISASSTISMTYDSALTFLQANVPPSHIDGYTLQWNVTDIPSLGSKQIKLEFNVPTSISLGTKLISYAHVEPLVDENNLTDNIDSLTQIVTGSFDPNDKLVTEGVTDDNLVLLNSKLTYTIRFQNTGTDTAFVVRVNDIIDPSFDLTSLEILGSSHTMEYSLNDRTLLFEFNDIKLPDSIVDEPRSHGYIKYRISHNADMPVNTVVKNSAAIFFDFNQPVLTNETSNKFVNELPTTRVTSVGKTAEQEILLYPNPSRNTFILKDENLLAIDFVEVISSQGVVLKKEKLKSSEISMSNYSPGAYIIRIYKKGEITTRKVILE